MPTDEELLSRQMPHNVEAEQAVLGSILIDSECLPQIVEQLKPDDFYIRQNREAFQTIYTMFSMSQKIDPVTVLDQMRLDGTYQEGVTREYFFQLMDVTPTVTNVMDYVAIVKDQLHTAPDRRGRQRPEQHGGQQRGHLRRSAGGRRAAHLCHSAGQVRPGPAPYHLRHARGL